jgi:hypothetical protein
MSGFCLWIEKGNREERKKKSMEYIVYMVGIKMELRNKNKNPIN